MIQIRVIKASRLALIVVCALFAIALAVFIATYAFESGADNHESYYDEAAVVVAASSSSVNVISLDSPYENEHTDTISDESFSIEVLPSIKSSSEIVSGEAKRVLIYHTHTHEAYTRSSYDTYVEETAWRTADQRYSIVRVGDELKELLGGFGIEAVHDTTDHEPPKLGTAYARSLETLRKYDDEHFDLYIDLHRDAYDESMAQARAVSVGGTDAARLMVLIGDGTGFDEKPDTAKNLYFARALTNKLNDIADGICRDVLIKVGRYNQHIGSPAILIEVGHNQNTLHEALASMPVLARALSDMLAEPSD